MNLRRLKDKDAPLMLEWMHDETVTNGLQADFASKTIGDVRAFIENSNQDTSNLHVAIVSDEDEYMGTVSLKHIGDGNAEFAIAIRTIAMGRGYAWFGLEEILKIAFEELDLESVYWCVSRNNTRAVKFYDKHNFHETIDIPVSIAKRYKGVENLKWYSVLRGDELNVRDTVADCKVLHIRTIPTVNAGELSFFEANNEIPFDIKRVYYISKVPEGAIRGSHAHKTLKQVLFCPYGRIKVVLENKDKREEIELSDPSIAILIDKPTWREMVWLQKDSVLCVAASDYYDNDDYIRNYDEFREYVGG